jgi:hypothetical protein
MIRRLLMLSILAIGSSPFAPLRAQSTDFVEAGETSQAKADVLKVEERRNQALIDGNANDLSALYTSDLVYTNAKGVVLSKDEHLADVRSGKLTLVTLKHSDVQVRIHGSTAVVTGVSTSSVKYDGRLSTGSRRFMDVYVKQDSRWLCAVHFETPIS